MAYNQERTEKVRQLLANTPEVTERKMFGSIGFIVNGKLCIGVGHHHDHVMMVRVGPEFYEQALRRKGAKPAIMRGREHRGYVFLDEKAVQRDDDLNYWVAAALKFNKILTSEKR